MISNKYSALLICLVSLAAHAQTTKDYALTAERNAWLTSRSGAALTSFNESNVTQGGIHFSHGKGDKYTLDNTSRQYAVSADVSSLFRLSPKTVLAGSITYTYDIKKEHSGTAFMSGYDVHPFDIIIPTAGNMKTEAIDLSAAFGWQMTKRLSVGAKAEYSVANRARQKDLRYSNFRMNLATDIGLYYRLSKSAMAASFFYRRTTEVLSFSRAGTTDIVHTSFIDYAGGLGINETYCGEGFTDDTEQPLFSEYKGASVQFSLPLASLTFFIDGLYARRSGYYGRESQYTIKHATHSSHCYSLHTRLTLQTDKMLHLLDACMNTECLTAMRTNYLSQTCDGVTSYTYYDPTKTVYKTQASGHIAYILHCSGWRASAGTRYIHRKQTAWLYPESRTTASTHWYPFATIQYNFPIKASVALNAGASISTTGIEYGMSVVF